MRGRRHDRGTCECGRRSRGFRSRSGSVLSCGTNLSALLMGGRQRKCRYSASANPQVPSQKESLGTSQAPWSCSCLVFFDSKTIQTLYDNTNKNAENNLAAGKKFSWISVTPEELYMELVFYMSVLNLLKVSDMWRVKLIFHVPFPHKVMSRDRFIFIAWNMHMSNPEEDAVNDRKKGKEDNYSLHRLRPLYDSLRTTFMAVYHLHQNLAVDE